MKGKFITIEGGEGVGKSSNIAFILSYLKNKKIDVVSTREPGGTVVSEKIRDLLLDATNKSMVSDTELLLMFAARAQHLEELIKPSLTQGKWVLCDRFTDATYAYQGGGRGISMQRIADLEQWVQGDLRPDLTILLDVSIEIGMKRASERSEPDRIEQEKNNFFESVRQTYLQMAKDFPQRYRIIDASQTLEQVQKDIATVLDEYSCNG